LPFPLCVSVDGEVTSVALGNVVLADHGETNEAEPLPEPQPQWYPHDHYRPELSRRNVTHCQDHTAYDEDTEQWQPAATALSQDPRKALPAVILEGNGESWRPQRDLLGSDRFATEFVVENDSAGRAFLRFGEDGIYGKTPRLQLTATYRTGNGIAGNIAADGIAHVVTALDAFDSVRNPLPASGATDPEPPAQVRLDAPQAFRTQERAVTEEDYARIAERHPEVQLAVGTRRWTGSWHTMFITVDRVGGRSVDAAFEAGLRKHIGLYRLAGQDVEIDSPSFIALDIAFTVCVKAGYFRSDVKQALLQVFSSAVLPDGQLGFFHPDKFTFGESVYLSQIVATAMAVSGVRWVDFDPESPKGHRFQRWGVAAGDELTTGRIDIGRLEIARLDNDPNAPENGKIEFYMEGGL
jgi:hypothetical protein